MISSRPGRRVDDAVPLYCREPQRPIRQHLTASAKYSTTRDGYSTSLGHSFPARLSTEMVVTSPQAEKGSQSGVILDAFDTRNVLSRDVQGVALLRGLHESRKVNNAVLHDDVLGRQVRPPVRLELCKKPLTNSRDHQCARV